MLELLLAPLVACLILTGIHAYLGLHVIERKVLFVDLSLAQIAALGTAAGFVAGYDLDSDVSYFFSLAFTLLGAAIFSLTRMRHERVPQEAIIGITYAVAASASILVLVRSAEGAERVKSMLVGSILFVDWHDIVKIGILYGLVGIFHYVFRDRFLTISLDPENAFDAGIPVRLWDFWFYASFGFVVTSSVRIAGVLLVFSFLVVPAVAGVLLARSVSGRLAAGWATGVVVSCLGLYMSVVLDLPTGAAVVVTFGVVLVIIALAKLILTQLGVFPVDADLHRARVVTTDAPRGSG
ncbi:MAG TPA: metal ABC transporter permease [Vicinamibacteria bacterium]|nr:metal ABC transporter permease [Vicinamibacteria bacterium]